MRKIGMILTGLLLTASPFVNAYSFPRTVDVYDQKADTSPVDTSQTYKLGIDGEHFCIMPLVKTEKGTFTAAHCIKPLVDKGYKKFIGQNKDGKLKVFDFVKMELIDKPSGAKGLDYALLTDHEGGGVPIGDSKSLERGQKVYLYSPKLGLSTGTISATIDDRLNPDLRYLKPSGKHCMCGESGSGVYNDKGEFIGVFVAQSGMPDDPDGLFVPVHRILERINGGK